MFLNLLFEVDMRFLQRASQAYQSISPIITCAARIVTISCVFLCMLWLSVQASSAVTHATLRPVGEDLTPSVELAWSGPADGQNVVSGVGDVRINIEAYNKKREKDIADASVKLLTLAIALRAELERDSASETSPNTVRKAKEIEKLAHDVKEMMKLNMVGPF